MSTYLKSERSEGAQRIAGFTGDGAYHGSSKSGRSGISPKEVEAAATTITKYVGTKNTTFDSFQATFPNVFDVKKVLPVPTQDEIKNDGTTFIWCPYEQALQEAGPITKHALQEMEPFLIRNKKFIYIDSKIQYFHANDLPVDSKLWHIDGSIAVRDQRVQDLGYMLLHDMKARLTAGSKSNYLAYQSSYHCATQFAIKPVTINLPECIASFDILDELVEQSKPTLQAQPAGSIVSFDGLSLHRAVQATADGWRLWIRCIETDREVKLNSSIIECYGTVYRMNQ